VSGFLLDTNIISELIKPKPEAKLTGWVESADEDLLYLSVLTVGEIGKGIAAMEQGRRSAAIQSWGETDLKPCFSGRVLPIDEATAARWGAITGAGAGNHGAGRRRSACRDCAPAQPDPGNAEHQESCWNECPGVQPVGS
jgi:predicted nucleic acid-binding protein